MEPSKSKKKTPRLRKSSKNDKDNKIVSEIIEGSNIGENITYDVLRMLLEYTNIKDLCIASKVCRSWNEAAKKEKETRIRPQNIFQEYNTGKEGDGILESLTDKLFIKPDIALLFGGTNKKNRCTGLLVYLLQKRVPRDTNFILAWNLGIVYDDLELEESVMSSLFLPKVPGVEIKSFWINEEQLDNFRATTNKRNREKMAREFCKISPKEDKIKSIIIFASEEGGKINDTYPFDDVKPIIKAITSHGTNNDKEETISIWGGLTCGLHVGRTHCAETYSEPDLAGISVCGAGVSTWSIVLDYRIKNKIQAERELTLFRDQVKLQKYSVGLMFSCCGRGADWYSEKHVEPKIFKKLFPNVPLVGSFGGGEFGVTTIPRESSKPSDIAHEFSTIFLILTYGSMRNMK